jgi:ATP adenylyltransferase
LWAQVVARAEHALAVGVLQTIETEERYIRDSGIDFVVRVRANLERKNRDLIGVPSPAGCGRPAANPFLPCDRDLFVTDLSPSHLLLLNRYNVLHHHLLVVTRSFEDQETLLDAADLTALASCMAIADGLAFYNAGRIAGASQPHKHLQWVPLPIAGIGPPIPIGPLLTAARYDGAVGRVPALPFRHAIGRIDAESTGRKRPWAEAAYRCYHALLAAVGIRVLPAATGQRQSAPYNLLLTRDWMLMVPRSAEHFEGISVNALGFAGSLFVRTAAELELIEAAGPMRALEAVAVASA